MPTTILPKPFSPAELVLRVERILERTDPGAVTEPAPVKGPIHHGDLVVDRDRHEVRVGNQLVALTAIEFRLLVALLEADGRVLTRDQLLDAVYGQDEAGILDRTVDVHIGRLRDKLGDNAEQPRYVATVRGAGYRAAPARADRRRRVNRDRAVIRRPGGIALQIALAALLVAGISIAILVVGVLVVGGQSFANLMAEHGESTDSSREMFMDSVGWVVVGTIIVAVAVAMSVASLLGARLALPLRDMDRAARQIAAGDYRARIPRKGPEEIVSLSDSFNQMAAALEEQERMRREFIANAAHELRTPLTNLQGYLEALRDGVIDADPATFESLLEESERLVRLSRSLDTLAAGDAGRRARDRRSRPRAADPIGGRPCTAGHGLGRSRAQRRRSDRPAGSWRSGPALPGALEPAAERGPLHAGGRPDRRQRRNGVRATSSCR